MYKPEWLSKGAEHLLKEWKEESPRKGKPYDVVIVGSGYGGAVAAARLSALYREGEGNHRRMEVVVLERGREHVPGTFPSSFSELPGHVRFSRFDDPTPMGSREGLFDFRVGRDVSMVVANGLGGGSLINAGVAAEPELDVFRDEAWPEVIRKEVAAKKWEQRWKDLRNALGAVEAKKNLEKHEQFIELFHMIGKSVDCTKITVDLDACKDCGDCATGCNFGAKKTLSQTYLAKAYKQGAELYTGATVSHVEKRGEGWAVFLGLTAQPHPIQEKQLHEIRARTVILAAGALGSTEILMRSRQRCPELSLSQALGTRFSTNGDIFHALFTEEKPVNCSPEESSKLADRKVGPTITGSTTINKEDRSERVVIEEMAIPGALRRVFEEVVTTAHLLKSFGSPDTSVHKAFDPAADPKKFDPDKDEVDPLAVDPKVIGRCQIFAAMGDDGAEGRLEPVPGWDSPRYRDRVNDGAIRVDWPRAGECPIFKRQADVFKKVGGAKRYLPNPLWQPLPKEISGQLAGEMPTGVVFTVHPLGGCPMGSDAGSGVVDHRGRVFDAAAAKDFHEGLLVLDGSIVPTALGTNPLLTITALAERALDFHVKELKEAKNGGWQEGQKDTRKLPDIDKKDPVATTAGTTAINFSERMTGDLSFDGGRKMKAELTLEFERVEHLRKFLCNPNRKLTVRSGVLRIQDPSNGRESVAPVHVKGSVGLLVRGKSTSLDREKSAIWAYIRTRLRDVFDSASKVSCWQKIKVFLVFLKGLGLKGLGCGGHPILDALGSIPAGKGYVYLASQIGEVRHLVYELTLQEALDLSPLGGPKDAKPVVLPKGTQLIGQKTLKYAAGANPWRQLVDLNLSAKPRDGVEVTFKLSVDVSYFFEGFRSRLAIAEQRDLPSAWMDLISLALFVARIVLKIHFWSFRLPDYQDYDFKREQRRLPGEMPPHKSRRYVVGYPQTPEDEPGVFPLLTRYCADDKNPGRPVLLIHGLGSGGIQFATERADPSLARHLVEEGYDVWVAELRTSIALPSSLDQWTIDEVARGDIPRLVDFVLAETSGKKPADEESGKSGKNDGKDRNGARPTIDVVAHCIGSAMFCTAVLDGKLQYASGESKIGRAALLQVGPLITLSKGTRLRCLAVAPLRRFLPDGLIDFSVDKRANWVESMIDRLLATYPYPEEEAKCHKLSSFGAPDLHIANCNRWAGIDGRMFLHRNMSEEMLEHLGEILGHSSMTIWGQTLQYAVLERLTDSNGINAYVTPENVRRYFTFPVRFLHGAQNDVFHPLTSLRSAELLKRIHGTRHDAKVDIIPEYAHLDPLIGKNARDKVFVKISAFLDEGRKVDAAKRDQALELTPATNYYFRRPLIGPVIGWLRPDPDSKDPKNEWLVRTWCRLDDLRSPASHVLVAVRKGKQAFGDPEWILCPKEDFGKKITSLVSGPFDTNLCVDVELCDGPGIYEVRILSAHESLEEKVSDDLKKAERDAGKRESADVPHLKLGRNKLPDKGTVETLVKTLDESEQKQRAKDASKDKNQENLKSSYEDNDNEKLEYATVTVPEQTEPPSRDSVTFAVASCRYPGWMPDRDRADATFGELRKLLEDKENKPSALFLVGDQIYADATAGAFDPKDARERFYEAYREAWTAPHARNVLSRLPTYMMMDDHEVGDNWHPGDFLEPREQGMRKQGLTAFKNYQWIHSPGNKTGKPGVSKAGLEKWYYELTLQGFPVFVCDTRTGREKQDRILDEEQFKDLERWLSGADKEQPKFIVSPSVVVPFLKSTNEETGDPGRSDGWDGFPADLRRLFKIIVDNNADNVVFLCGDPHISMRAKIWFKDADGTELPLKCHCFVSSPMYAPYPFANGTPRDYLEDNDKRPVKLEGSKAPGLIMRYQILPLSDEEKKQAEKKGGQGQADDAKFFEPASFCLVTASWDGTGWSVKAKFVHEVKSKESQDKTSDRRSQGNTSIHSGSPEQQESRGRTPAPSS